MISEVIRVDVLDNGFVVCVANPPPKKDKDGHEPYVEYDRRYTKLAAADEEAVMKIIKEALPKVKEYRPDPVMDFSAGFKEATAK